MEQILNMQKYKILCDVDNDIISYRIKDSDEWNSIALTKFINRYDEYKLHEDNTLLTTTLKYHCTNSYFEPAMNIDVVSLQCNNCKEIITVTKYNNVPYYYCPYCGRRIVDKEE